MGDGLIHKFHGMCGYYSSRSQHYSNLLLLLQAKSMYGRLNTGSSGTTGKQKKLTALEVTGVTCIFLRNAPSKLGYRLAVAFDS